MSDRAYWPVMGNTYTPRNYPWLARRGTASRVAIVLLTLLALCGLIALVVPWVKANWPAATPFTLAGAMLTGMPVGSFGALYVVGAIFAHPNPPRWQR